MRDALLLCKDMYIEANKSNIEAFEKYQELFRENGLMEAFVLIHIDMGHA